MVVDVVLWPPRGAFCPNFVSGSFEQDSTMVVEFLHGGMCARFECNGLAAR